uniref:EamA domain-containing protein n=2 Tax=Corethron hystrix TaxID=216773 RepID=A0A6U5EGX2_9STRA|mmetsp:Transcript_17491/g.39486  ORF Transcript_17491/g.39486 Transcript_17491/m.39486 type:complete len:207 (+) Transcript_17491:1119-1739(+)
MLGVLLFSSQQFETKNGDAIKSTNGNVLLGTAAVLTEVTLSGFASIYFEKVVKKDSETFSIWERNFQLALWSFPVYILFILNNRGGEVGYGGGWSLIAVCLSFFGAAGGLLVALSIKYGDSVLKTLATTGSIILSSYLDHYFLGGPLEPVMKLAGVVVILAICNYTFDRTPVEDPSFCKNILSSQVHKKKTNDVEIYKETQNELNT